MKTIAIGTTAVLSVLLGIAVSAFAVQDRQGEKQNESKPQQNSRQQGKAQPRQPGQAQSQPQKRAEQQPRQAQEQPQKQAGQSRQARDQPQRPAEKPTGAVQNHPQERPNQPAQSGRVDQGNRQTANQQQQRPQERQRTWQDHRASNWQSDHRNWQQRGGYNGYRIPEERYGGFFGVDHSFRIGGLPFMDVGGFPRFQYEGYWFSMVDPWPADWDNDWYDTDDVYVSYMDNGYYLFDRRHPGIGIAISVSM